VPPEAILGLFLFITAKTYYTIQERRNMRRCNHTSCGAAEKVWLPNESAGQVNGLKAHPYCIHCGVVKNISSNKAKPLGYYTNVLARMPLTKVQMRLMIKELENMGFEDAYSMTKSAQDNVFISIVQKYCKGKVSLRGAYSF